jgi:hypothetical protein
VVQSIGVMRYLKEHRSIDVAAYEFANRSVERLLHSEHAATTDLDEDQVQQ